jgi:phospholipase/lecithinase/hemolysin
LTALKTLVVVGDSLSDGGNGALLSQQATGGMITFPPAPYAGGRVSNGPVAVENLWQRFNPGDTNFRPSLAGGTNYALFGSTTGLQSAIDVNTSVPDGLKPAYKEKSNAWQLSSIKNNVSTLSLSFDSSTSLFVVWVFPNDVFYWAATGQTPGTFDGRSGFTASPDLLIGNGIQNILGSIDTLVGLGATNLLIPNMPDLASTPFVMEMNDPMFSNLASQITQNFNLQLELALGRLESTLPASVTITQFQSDDLFASIQQDPAGYGLSNVSQRCFVAELSSICSDPDAYLFWDGNHPTAAAHRIIGNSFYDAVRTKVPGPMPLMGAVAAFGWSRRLRRRIAGRSVLLDSPAVVPSGLTFRLQAEQRGPQDQQGPQHGPRADRFPEQPPAPHPGKHHLRIADGRGSSRR